MEKELLIVNGDINGFISGNMELNIWGMGYNNLTVKENKEFSDHLGEIMGLLRVGTIRTLKESSLNEEIEEGEE